MNLLKQKSLLLICLLLGQVSLVGAGTLREFTADDYQTILAERQGKPFVLVMWSVDCAPCHRELAMLGELRQVQPQLDVVLISTDVDVEQAELQSVLSRHRLHSFNSYVFGDTPVESQRFAIDPTWYGELPRSYLFDRLHRRQAVSGVLSEELLVKWLVAE